LIIFLLAVSFGITGKDYVLFASDTSAARSIVKMKSTEDKQKVVGKHLCMACKSSPLLSSPQSRDVRFRRVIHLSPSSLSLT